MRNVVSTLARFPKSLPDQATVAEVAFWAGEIGKSRHLPLFCLPATWRFLEEEDGTIMIIPTAEEPEPGFAIIPQSTGEYVVLVSDPEEMDELGPFNTLKEALAGISHWLALPARISGWQGLSFAC